MRYFVLSYVTNPTTISAITEIPANTPRPIGNTLNFFPGNAKAEDWEEAEALAAAAEAEEAAAEEEAALSAAEVAEVVVAPDDAEEEELPELLPPLEEALDPPDELEDAEAEPDAAAPDGAAVGVAAVDTVEIPF